MKFISCSSSNSLLQKRIIIISLLLLISALLFATIEVEIPTVYTTTRIIQQPIIRPQPVYTPPPVYTTLSPIYIDAPPPVAIPPEPYNEYEAINITPGEENGGDASCSGCSNDSSSGFGKS